MKRAAPRSGFTVIETMIVLAVTGLLFVTATVAWSGRQRASDYLTAVEDVRSRTLQVYSDVDNGFFPDASNFGCKISGASLEFLTSGTQGTNGGCVFQGKAIQFRVEPKSPEPINIMSIAGINDPGSLLAASAPTIAPSLTESQFLRTDLQTVKVRVNSNNSYTGVAFIANQGTKLDGSLQTGRQSIRVYGIRGALGTTGANVGATNNRDGKLLSEATNLTAPTDGQGVKVCFKSLGTANYLLMTIGANGSAGDVKTITSTTTDCGI